MIQAVFFDLDGTLVDTAPDLGNALNLLLAEKGRPAIPLKQLRPHVSGGARALIRTGLSLTPENAEYDELQKRFLALYEAHLADHSRLFPGMNEVLESLEKAGLPWGIITNKVSRYTLPLVEKLGLHERAACVISGDSAARAKPAPDPLLLACTTVGVLPKNCIYLGDDLRDIQAGQAANMKTVAVRWGYLGDGPLIETWGADRVIDAPGEILRLIQT